MLYTYTFSIDLTCLGCAGRVHKILKDLKDRGSVVRFHVNLGEKQVTVITKLGAEEIRAELLRCGTTVDLIASGAHEPPRSSPATTG